MMQRLARLSRKPALLLVSLVALAVPPSEAVTPQGTVAMQVDATVQATCHVATVPIVFGPYRGVKVDVTGTITVTCSNTVAYYVNLSNGLQPACCWPRRMAGPNAGRLSYEVYRDASRSNRWGNTLNYDGLARTGTGTAQTLTTYARLFGAQSPTPGAYTDTIVATVHF